MLDTFLLTVNAWIAGGTILAAAGCFLWGMVSVLFSPCHLASIPLIVAYVGGQEKAIAPRQAGVYAAAFTTGLFITIALVGIVCAVLGRMLGDVGSYWQVLVGGVLIWVALGMLGVEKCSLSSGGFLQRLNFRGVFGAFGLGLGYGVLSGSCTFGFIAPILAIITVQQKIATGILFILFFAYRSLPADHGGRQFHCGGPKSDGKQRLARSRNLVSKRGRGRHLPFGGLFHR